MIVAPATLSLRSELPNIGWSFGVPLWGETTSQANCLINVSIDLDAEVVHRSHRNELEKFHYWFGSRGSRSLVYHREWFGLSEFGLILGGLGTSDLSLRVSPNYFKQIRFRFNNLHSVGYLLTDIVGATALGKGWAPLHCSAFSLNGKVGVIVAAPDTGKTLTTMSLVLKEGASFICEDLAFTNGVAISGCPGTSTFRYYDSLSDSRDRIRAGLTKYLPPFELVGGRVPRTISDYVPQEQIVDRPLDVSYLFFLERGGAGEAESFGGADVVERLLAVNRYEFRYLTSPAILSANYFSGLFPVEDLVASERAVLNQLALGAETHILRAKAASAFAGEVLEVMS